MSKLGFNNISSKLRPLQRKFLLDGIRLAQQEFKENFESESNKESGSEWLPVIRDTPPPILYETGSMEDQSINNKPDISIGLITSKATLTVNPVDSRGKEYAQYHEQDGTGEFGTSGEGGYGNNIQREFITQSDDLTAKQEALLLLELDRLFK